MKAVLTAKGIAKAYDNNLVLKGIDLELFDREIFGLLGPNGAGKSTFARILIGFERQDSGTVQYYDGLPPQQTEGKISIVPQQNSFYLDFSVRQNMEFFSSLYGLPGDAVSENVENLLSWLKLEAYSDRKAKHLSGGYRKLLNIACSLVHNPDIIFMDEPTVGLDPNMRQLIWRKITDLKKNGKTILLTTHYMDEAQELSDRIAMISGGKIIVEGEPDQLITRHGGEKIVTLQLSKPPEDRIIASLEKALPSSQVKSVGSFLIISFMQKHSIERISAIVEWLVEQGYTINRSSIKEPELEDVFFNVTGENLSTGERVEQ